VAAIAAVAGVLGFTFLTEQPTLVRLAALVGGLTIGAAIAWFSEPGKRFLAYARESYQETRRVVWPTRKETISTTGIVFGFVVLMALFLFLVDKSLEWFLYDLLLSWR
jgi:preprotein translocase subunit SecE